MGLSAEAILLLIQGRRHWGSRGWSPHPKFEVGGTAHPSVPPIFREIVLSNARESTNRVKEGVIKEFFSEIGLVVVLVSKGSYTTLNIVKDTGNLGKERKNPKNLVND